MATALTPASGSPPPAPASAPAAAPFRMARVGRQSLVYGGGMLLAKAVAFAMLPVYTRLLTPADYGVLDLIQMTFEVVTIFTGSTLVAGVFRFYAKNERLADKEAVVSSALVTVGITYALAGVLAAFAAPSISQLTFSTSQHAHLFRIAAGSMVAEGLLLVPFAYLRIRDRSRLFVVLQTAKLVLQLSLNIVFLVGLHTGVAGVLWSGLVANSVFGLALTAYVLKDIPARVDTGAIRDLLRFGIPLIGARVAGFVTTFGDRYFIQAFAGSAAVGLYSLSYQFGFLLGSLSLMPFSMVWEPVSFEVAKRPDRDEIFARTFVYFNLLLVTLAVGLALFADPVLRVMAAPAFYPAARVVPVILAAFVLQAWANFHNIGLMVTERTGVWTAANWVTMGVVVAGYFALIPTWGGLGAALATLLAFVVREVVVYRASQRVWPLRYRWGPVWLTLLPGAAVVAAGAALPPADLARSLGLRTGLFAGFAALCWMLPVLTAADRARIRAIARNPRAALQGLAQ